MDKGTHILVGKIGKAHALRGGVNVTSFAESPDVFDRGRQLIVVGAGGTENAYTVSDVKTGGRTVILFFAGIDSREAADALKGCELYAEKSSLPPAEHDSYYWFDIIGLEVHSVSGEYIGRVMSILPTGSNDVYVVKREGAETLIPGVEGVVLSIDLERKNMCVDLPEGLSP